MKRTSILITLLIILSLSVFSFVHYTTISYDFSGTYSAKNEPSENNLYVVLKNETYTIYNQEEILNRGPFEKANLNSKLDIYKLFSKKGTLVGYIIKEKNQVALLNFKGMDFSLEKISKNAIYINYKSE